MLVQATDEAVVIADVPIHQIELHQLRATKKMRLNQGLRAKVSPFTHTANAPIASM